MLKPLVLQVAAQSITLLQRDYFNNELDLKKYKKYPLPVLMFHHSRDTLDRINNIILQETTYSKHLELAGRVDC